VPQLAANCKDTGVRERGTAGHIILRDKTFAPDFLQRFTSQPRSKISRESAGETIYEGARKIFLTICCHCENEHFVLSAAFYLLPAIEDTYKCSIDINTARRLICYFQYVTKRRQLFLHHMLRLVCFPNIIFASFPGKRAHLQQNAPAVMRLCEQQL